MIPGLSPETASSLALAPPRHVPRHRHLRGRRPGHDPPRREGRGSYQPRSDPLPLLARRFKRLSAVPWAPTWRPGPRHGVLERPRTARTARRLRAAQSLTGVVVSRGSAASFRLVGAGRDAPWLGASVSPFYTFTETYHLFPCPPLLLTPQIYFLSRGIFRRPSAYDPDFGSVVGRGSRAVRGGPALDGGLPRTAAPGWQSRYPPARKVLSNVCWLLWLLLRS